MAKTTHQLTAIAVVNLKRQGLHPDGNGLFLRITGSGTKNWICRLKRTARRGTWGLDRLQPCPSPRCATPLGLICHSLNGQPHLFRHVWVGVHIQQDGAGIAD
jgi:hypothetical protein